MSEENHDYSNMTAEQLNKSLDDITNKIIEKQKELSQIIQGSKDPLEEQHIKNLNEFRDTKLKPLDNKYDAILAALVEISEKSDDEKSDDIIVIDDGDDDGDDGDDGDDDKNGGRRRRRRSGRKGKKTRKMRKSKKCGCKKGRKGKKGKKMTRRRRRHRR